MEKTYLQLNIVNIVTIGFIFVILYSLSGTVVAGFKTYWPSSSGS